MIFILDKATQIIIDIKKRLEAQLKTHIRRVYVSVGGQSIIGMRNVVSNDLQVETVIKQEVVNEMMDINRNTLYPNRMILDAITLEYKVDGQYQVDDPVGIQCAKLEGNFLNITQRKSFDDKLRQCFAEAGITIADTLLAPLTLADCVLNEAERRSGCVLVDLGADTTTVSVYYKNILRHLVVLPIGMANITHDLTTLEIEEMEAEQLKLKYGCAYTDNADIDNAVRYPLSQDRFVDSGRFVEIGEARMMEIIENVWYQVPAEYAGKMLSGIILTGGGANMKNIERAFRHVTKIEKIRIAKTVKQLVDATQPEIKAQDCRMLTALGMIAKGDMNCAGGDISDNMFDEQEKKVEEPTPEEIAAKMEEERRAAEEQAAREEEERLRQEEEEARLKRENSWGNRLMRGIKRFVNNALTEEE